MKKIFMATVVVLFINATAFAQEWKSSVERNGLRKAQVWAEGNTPDGEAKTGLTIQCSSGKGAMTSIIYSVVGADKMQRFSFDDFEGPDAVAAKKELTTISVVLSIGGAATETTAVTGYFADADTFAFELSAKANEASKVNKLITAMASPQYSKIRVTVQDNRNAQRTIQTEFPVTGAANAIQEAMKGCGAQKLPSKPARPKITK
jgi:hypothetical protein